MFILFVVYLMKIIKLQMEDTMYIYGDREGHVRFCRGHEINDILMFMNLIHTQPFVTKATWDYNK